MLQLSSALYPVGRGGCSIGFGGGETSVGYSMIFLEAVWCRDPGTLSVLPWSAAFLSSYSSLDPKKVLLSTDFSSLSQVSLPLFTVDNSPLWIFYLRILRQHCTWKMCQEMIQCSDILHRTAINFQISYLKLNTNILHIADSSSKSLIQYIYIIISFVCILYDFF